MKIIFKYLVVFFIVCILVLLFVRNSSNNAFYWWPIVGGARYIVQPNDKLINKYVCSQGRLMMYPDARFPNARVPSKYQTHKLLMGSYIIPNNSPLENPLLPASTPLKIIGAFRVEPKGIMDAPFWNATDWLEAKDKSGNLYLLGNQNWPLCE